MVAEYAARFENLVRYFPHYQGEAGERSKCVKFVNGLRLELKMMVNYHYICLEMHNDLMKLVTMEEVKFAIFSMDSYKAPSVDGFQSIFCSVMFR